MFSVRQKQCRGGAAPRCFCGRTRTLSDRGSAERFSWFRAKREIAVAPTAKRKTRLATSARRKAGAVAVRQKMPSLREGIFCLIGGCGWIRTTEAKTQQIYSLSPLATRERIRFFLLCLFRFALFELALCMISGLRQRPALFLRVSRSERKNNASNAYLSSREAAQINAVAFCEAALRSKAASQNWSW